MILLEAGRGFFGIFRSVENIFQSVGFSEGAGAAIKILGLGYLFGICADVCRELGENSIAKAVEVAGRAEILMVVIPFLEEIIEMGAELLS
jgi:stage III sporulation protein AD